MTEVAPFLTTSTKAEAAFVEAVRDWRFRPFQVRDRAIPVCAMSRVVYPPGADPDPESLPMSPPPSRSKKRPVMLAAGKTTTELLKGHRIAGTIAIVPDDETKVLIQRARIRVLTAKFRLCIDDAGLVESVLPLESSGSSTYDAKLIAQMRSWKYTPFEVDGQPVPICTYVSFIYKQR